MARIHPSAIVDKGAELGEGVVVEAFSIIEKQVRIGARTHVGPHVVIRDHTQIGADCKIFQFSSIGESPQHQDYQGEPTQLKIGDRNILREYCTVNRGTAGGLGVTSLGDDNFVMAYTHIAHDCTLGSHIIFANGASLAGHVAVGDYAVVGGFSLVHQHCNIGTHSITGIGTVCFQDIPPYIVAAGNTARPYGLNTKGLQRRNFARETMALLKKAYQLLYRSNLEFQAAITAIEDLAPGQPELSILCAFLRDSQRGIIR